MSPAELTRRSLLSAAAGAVVAGVARPASLLAAVAPPPRTLLRGLRLGRLAAGTHTIDLEGPVDLLGLRWAEPTAPEARLRLRSAGGRWSPWASAAGHGHGPDLSAPTGSHVGDPIWLGGASVVQLHLASSVSGVGLELIDVTGGMGAGGTAWMSSSLRLAAPVLAAGAGQPQIIARTAWAQGASRPKVAPEYGAVKLAFVHHTENPNGYSASEVPAMLRAIYAFHRYVNGWNDIGYNFVIDLYGRIFEARAGGIDEPVVGAHAGGYNLLSTGVAVLGSFMSAPISAAAHRSLEYLLAWKLSLHGVRSTGRVTVRVNPAGAVYSRFPANARVSLPRIAGHRDGDSTDCPGDVLYGELAGVRKAVAHLAPSPLRATLELSPTAPATPPVGELTEAQQLPTLSGTLTLLDGTQVAGAPVQIQIRHVSGRGELVSERTLAELVSDEEGRFTLPAAFSGLSGRVWLRALCPGAGSYGATVSDPLRVDLLPVTLPAGPAPTPPAAAPPAS